MSSICHTLQDAAYATPHPSHHTLQDAAYATPHPSQARETLGDLQYVAYATGVKEAGTTRPLHYCDYC